MMISRLRHSAPRSSHHSSVPPLSKNPARQIAIGDIHGCVHALDALLNAIAPTPRDELIFLGDLIDQGADSREVLQHIIDLKRRTSVVLIRGNHEEMLLAATENEKALRYWENCGGVATLNSYRFGGRLDDIPKDHWLLLDECRDYYETDTHIFTHASYSPHLPMQYQPDYQLRWALFEPDRLEPHVSGKPVLVGHTEQKNGDILDLGFATCIDTACWRYGWLTALEVHTRELWQASRWGLLRDRAEPTPHNRLRQLFRKDAAEAPVSIYRLWAKLMGMK
jgi:serine/threonine protein phosphatase 1